MCLISAELILKHVRGDTGTAPVAEPGGGTVFDRPASGGPAGGDTVSAR